MVDVKKAAQLLISARRDGRKMETLPPEAEPKTLADAYAIQEEIVNGIGLALGGWKVALTNDEAMARAGAKEPAAGPLFAPHIVATPQTIEKSSETVGGFECEFAFRLGKDIPAEGVPYTGQVVAAAVESLHPAIEVTGIRFASRPALGVRGTVADHAGNFSFVYGPAVAVAHRAVHRAPDAGRLRAVGLQLRYVVGDERLHEVARLRAVDPHLAHVADVEEAGRLAHRAVLLDDAGVLHRHVEAGERHHPRTERDVCRVQRRGPEGGRLHGRGGARRYGGGCGGAVGGWGKQFAVNCHWLAVGNPQRPLATSHFQPPTSYAPDHPRSGKLRA